jgi:SNW domain-containing protein 1
VQVNDKFAKLSESLHISERNAREEIKKRAEAMLKIRKKQKEVVEDDLRDRAAQARRLGTAKGKALEDREAGEYGEAVEAEEEAPERETEEDFEQRQAREELRKEREREMRREVPKQLLASNVTATKTN